MKNKNENKIYILFIFLQIFRKSLDFLLSGSIVAETHIFYKYWKVGCQVRAAALHKLYNVSKLSSRDENY